METEWKTTLLSGGFGALYQRYKNGAEFAGF
jgi:hypothetical protein